MIYTSVYQIALCQLVMSLLLMTTSTWHAARASQQHVQHVSYQEMMSLMRTFSSAGVRNFRALLLDPQHGQLIAAASDNVFRLSAYNLSLLERFEWKAEPSHRQMCIMKGREESECHNHVLILHQVPASRGHHRVTSNLVGLTDLRPPHHHLLMCGTGAFHPQCSRRHLLALKHRISSSSGVAVCPYSPHYSFTSLVTSSVRSRIHSDSTRLGRLSAAGGDPEAQMNRHRHEDVFIEPPLAGSIGARRKSARHRKKWMDDAPLRQSGTQTASSNAASDGVLYTATSSDFSGDDSIVHRQAVADIRMLRTNKFDSRQLNRPHFVSSFETRDHVYFVFREEALEKSACGKTVYSRLARVCKNDRGTPSGHNWSTFLKARLVCSVTAQGAADFHFDHVRSAHYMSDTQVLYAIFSTEHNALAGSALCAYSLSAIESFFTGPILHQTSTAAPWHTVHVNGSDYQCGVTRLSSSMTSSYHIKQLSMYSLMKHPVLPDIGRPLYVGEGFRLEVSAVDSVRAELGQSSVHVIFAADRSGVIRRLVVSGLRNTACLLTVMTPFVESTEVLSMKLLSHTNSLYIGVRSSVVQIPLHSCDTFNRRSQCLKKGHPYCTWLPTLAKCQDISSTNPYGRVSSAYGEWLSAQDVCRHSGVMTRDGSRSGTGNYQSDEWSEWSSCWRVDSGNSNDSSAGKQCWCRHKRCFTSSFSSTGSGRHSEPTRCGLNRVQVTNCTVDGGWTSWSAWSSCSGNSSTGGVQRRRRSCTNPSPAFGGRRCVGYQAQKIFCQPRQPSSCRPPRHSLSPTAGNAASAAESSWSRLSTPSNCTQHWGPWSKCSAICGGGFRRRTRLASSTTMPTSERCQGDTQEDFDECNTHPCRAVLRRSDWTVWLRDVPYRSAVKDESEAITSTSTVASKTAEESSAYKRFRFTCSARVADSDSIWISTDREDANECPSDHHVCITNNDSVGRASTSAAASYSVHHVVAASVLSVFAGAALTAAILVCCRDRLRSVCCRLRTMSSLRQLSTPSCHSSATCRGSCCSRSTSASSTFSAGGGGRKRLAPMTSLCELAEIRRQYTTVPHKHSHAMLFQPKDNGQDGDRRPDLIHIRDQSDLRVNLQCDSIF